MCTWVNEDSWGMMKTCFPDAKQIKKCQNNVLCKECTYVQKDINENDEKIYSTEDNKPTFLSSYFLEESVFTVENIEERLNEMNLDRVQKKEKNCHLKNMTKIEQLKKKEERKTPPDCISS